MATYSTEIVSTWGQEEVFEYLSTFSNAREWDPGVTEGESMSPGPADVGSVYRLAVRIAGRIVPFDYRVVDIDRPRRVVLQAAACRDRLDGHHHGGAVRVPAPGSATRQCSRDGACCAWRRPSSPGPSPAWQTGRPPGCAGRWRDPGAARPYGGHRARGERRRQLQPGRLPPREPPRALAAAVRPHRPCLRRHGRLVGDRPGGCTRAGTARRLGVARRPE